MNVVKSDAKGRVSIGFKDTHFKVHKLGRTILLEAVHGPMELLTYPAPKPALDYLESFGLDPHRISGESADELGYDEFAEKDENGKAVYEYGRRKSVRKPWPEGFEWPTFVRLAVGVEVDDDSA